MGNPNPELFQLSVFNRHPTNYQSNLFTESRQEFTELEKKIVTLVVNQIGNIAVQGKLQPNVNMVVTVPYNALTKTRYDQISEAAESLWKKRLSYKNPDKDEFVFITPFPVVRSITANGLKTLEITMLANVVPHFAALGQRYTKYDLDVMLSLTSVYAQRMFEIVSMNFHVKKMRFTYIVDDLRNILNCPITYRYVDFRINVLEIAQRELQQKAGINLDWTPSRKEGKKVVELTFTIKTSHQLALDSVKQDRQAINQMSINEAVTTAWQLMKNYDLKSWQKDIIVSNFTLLETFYRIDSELANGLRINVKNPTAYLIKSLGIDQQKAPKKTTTKVATLKPTSAPQPMLPFDSTVRSATTQSMASILGSIIVNGGDSSSQ